eukprot:2111385-Pyramimonas_sp.AAC.1
MDGSCARHTIRELSRAAYAWILLGPEEDIVAYAIGTVWDVLPQTPQVAEHQAMSLIPFFVPYSGVGYSDCMTVVKLCMTDASHQVDRRH